MKTTDMQLRHLEHKHRRIDSELGQLMQRVHLTPAEYQQALALKKRKLQLKDGIAALLHRDR
jgi:uncharacterized protein YdcH (DUF465 family)